MRFSNDCKITYICLNYALCIKNTCIMSHLSHKFITSLSAVMLLATSSCATINEILGQPVAPVSSTTNPVSPKKTVVTATTQEVASPTQAQSTATEAKETTPTENKKKTKTNKKKKSTAKTPAVTKTPVATVFQPGDSAKVMNSLGGEWLFMTVAGKTVEADDERPMLVVEESTGRFYATNGCNVFNGDVILPAPGKLRFDNVLASLNLCDEQPWTSAITALWDKVAAMAMKQTQTASLLELKNADGLTIATLKRHSLDAVNGLWEVISINGKKIESERPSIVIDIPERSIHGKTGCNIFNGTIFLDPTKKNSLQFQDMNVTKMSCPNEDVERALLVGLENVEQVTLNADGTVSLTDNAGKRQMVLKQLEKPE